MHHGVLVLPGLGRADEDSASHDRHRFFYSMPDKGNDVGELQGGREGSAGHFKHLLRVGFHPEEYPIDGALHRIFDRIEEQHYGESE